MKIRAYHSDSVESAIRQARIELGDEAVLLDSRKMPPEGRHLGQYEVRFAIPGQERMETRAPVPTRQTAANKAESGISELSRGLEEIRRLLYTYTHSSYLPHGRILSQPELARLYQELTAGEVEPELAAQLTASLLPAAERGAGQGALEQALAEQIEAMLPVSDELGRPDSRPRVLALVGPAGVGKTTTIAKLAIQCGIGQRRPVHLLTIDNNRVAAVDQLHTFASILAVGWTAVDEVAQLSLALAGFRDPHRDRPPELVLIDTPGHGFQDLARSSELAGFLRSRADIDTHLVVSASTKPRDLRRILEEYATFGPRKLLFTKLDETLSFGPLLNEAVRTGWPLSFLGTGQRIPEDLKAATRGAVVDLLLNRQRRAASS